MPDPCQQGKTSETNADEPTLSGSRTATVDSWSKTVLAAAKAPICRIWPGPAATADRRNNRRDLIDLWQLVRSEEI